MTATPSSEARAEAERRWEAGSHPQTMTVTASALKARFIDHFEEGAEWKGAQGREEELEEFIVYWALGVGLSAYTSRFERLFGGGVSALLPQPVFESARERLEAKLRADRDYCVKYGAPPASGVESSDEGEADGKPR